MKRAMTGGAHRGPLALGRQRRTLRFVQILLVLIAAALLVFAGYALGKRAGYDDGTRAEDIDPPARPSISETLVPATLGLAAFGAALALQGQGGMRMPSPARLEELAGRAEQAAIDRAEEAADSKAASPR